MSATQIDFTPLNALKIKSDQERANEIAKRPVINVLRLIGALLLVIAAPFIFVLVFGILFSASKVLGSVALCAIFFGFWLLYLRKNRKFKPAFQQFLKINNWNSGDTAPLGTMLQKLGYNAQPADITGALDGHRFWLYTATPPLDSKNLQPISLLSVEFNRQLPTLLLFPGAGPFGLLVNEMAKNDFGLAPLKLEGDFNKRIKAYYQAGAHIHTLEYLTPDVMAVVQDKVTDIVLYDSQTVSVSTSANVPEDIPALKSLFQSAQLLIKEIDEKATLEKK